MSEQTEKTAENTNLEIAEVAELTQLVANNPLVFGETKSDPKDALRAATFFLTEEVNRRAELQKHLRAKTLGEVVVVITIPGFGAMEFLFAKQLSSERRKNRQAWLGMTEADEKDKQHEVTVKTLANLLRSEPLGVPDWDEAATGETLIEKFVTRFLDEENEVFIVQLNSLYLGKLLPDEYYRPRSE